MGRMRVAATVASVGLLLVQVTAVSATGVAPGSESPAVPAAPIESGLLDDLGSDGGRFIVEFGPRADLRGAAAIADRDKRGDFVLDRLTATAGKAQAEALALVEGTRDASAESHFILNAMVVDGDAALARKLAALDGVTRIRAIKVYPLIKPVEVGAVIAQLTEPDWGVARIRAPEVWDQGIVGQGVVVANVDTGVQFDHPAIVSQYRGNLGDGAFDHAYNWWDPTGICGDTPCDNAGHGTHTMGTIVGGDGPGPFTPDIGVAPGASWIAAKGCEDLFCSEDALLAAGEFLLAPTDLAGENPDPSKRPDIINNSWGGSPQDAFYLATVQAWRAAGIIPVFAAGNDGPDCGTGGAPGVFPEVISVGATDGDDAIAEFSSRGPSPFEKPFNPNVSAPGVDVLSSVPGDGFAVFSGTSMATPHTVGAIALVLASESALEGDFDGVRQALYATAVDRPDPQCGGPDESDDDPNNVYGEGRIDAKAAVDLVSTGGTLAGRVTDAATSGAVAGARISASDGERAFSTFSAPDGTYDLFLAAGEYLVSIDAFGYETAARPGVIIVTDQTTTEDFALTALPRFTVSGTILASEDGSPIEGAQVKAVGTPVDPAESDAAGRYSLVLPIGSFSLRVTAGGCSESATADIFSDGADVETNFSLFRKIDDFGHGCRAIPLDWVDANDQTALFGDDFVGRLRLPFPFEFYGQSYGAVYLSDNGYLNFLGPDQFNAFPISIPNTLAPNAAIYVLWQDLFVDEEGAIEHATVGTAPDRTFVIEYDGIRSRTGAGRVDLEVKLHENGTIDLLYGANPPFADGRNATVGIEDADGTDALELTFLDDVIGRNRAYRIERVPTGIVRGTVIDTNDGLPVEQANVTALPGARHASTDASGAYELRLRPGSYSLTTVASGYAPELDSVVVTDGGEVTVDFLLEAPRASVDPTAIEATVAFGTTTSAAVTLTNDGSATLAWTARERSTGVTPPDLPPLPTIQRTFGYRSMNLPANLPLAPVRPVQFDDLPIVVDDPDDDSLGAIETTAIRAESDGEQTSIKLEFAPGSPVGSLGGGYVYLDVDQDAGTGLPPEAFFGLPTQDIGVDYLASLLELSAGPEPIVPIFDLDGNLLAVVPATVTDTSIAFSFPLSAVGGDDGIMDIATDNGVLGPEDWAPDVGHGTIEAFSDVPWMSATPESGEIAQGGSTEILLTLGEATLDPGEYTGQLVFVTNAPRISRVPVEVTLTVTLPDAFGAIEGTVSDAHTGDPIADATVTVHATLDGQPLDRSAVTDEAGQYRIIGPAGSWPTAVVAEGYVEATPELTITAGATTSGADVSLHRRQPHAVIEGGPFEFVLTPGRTASGALTITNPEGHADLEFSLAERPLATASPASPTGGPAAGTSSHERPTGWTPRRVAPEASGDPVLVLMDSLPWDSDGLLQVLDANGIPYDVAGSAELDTVDLSRYQSVFVASDQSQAFYDAFFGRAEQVGSFVLGGGLLWFGAAAFGFNDGDLDGVVLPGGLTINGPVFEDENDVVMPDHPIMAGVPDPFTGTSASHITFSDVPEGGTVIAQGSTSGDPTLVEYDYGGGRVIALGQTLEYAWQNDQDGKLILENGVPYANAFIGLADVPWLSIEPTSGSIAPDGATEIAVQVDSSGLEPGRYRAIVVLRTNDPDNGVVVVPVSLLVPSFQQGINPGGRRFVNANGDVFAADQRYRAGSFGYVGPSTTRSTRSPIARTDDDPLFADLRSGMRTYRFDLANGRYRVDLSFAELSSVRVGERVFSVWIEGVAVIGRLDVRAAAGARNAALVRTFEVDVADGILDIEFVPARGSKPIVNGILVTEAPSGP